MRAKEFTVKPRDPNWKTLQAKRTSGASGSHKDKKRQQKQGYEKHKKPMDVSEATSYGQLPADAVRVLWNVYQKASQGVEQHRDADGAKRIASELDAAAKSLGVSQYMKSLYNGAAYSARMDYDTDPGDFKNWFTYVGDHLEGLYNIHKEKGSYDDDEPDLEPDVD